MELGDAGGNEGGTHNVHTESVIDTEYTLHTSLCCSILWVVVVVVYDATMRRYFGN